MGTSVIMVPERNAKSTSYLDRTLAGMVRLLFASVRKQDRTTRKQFEISRYIPKSPETFQNKSEIPETSQSQNAQKHSKTSGNVLYVTYPNIRVIFRKYY